VSYKAQELLARCKKVRATSTTGTWIACCPAHEDKNPSMTVRELTDGRVLIHCFSGCSAHDILESVGLTFDALFPEKLEREQYRPTHTPFPAADVLAALANELTIVKLLADDMIAGQYPVGATDHERLRLARDRIESGVKYALGLDMRRPRSVKR